MTSESGSGAGSGSGSGSESCSKCGEWDCPGAARFKGICSRPQATTPAQAAFNKLAAIQTREEAIVLEWLSEFAEECTAQEVDVEHVRELLSKLRVEVSEELNKKLITYELALRWYAWPDRYVPRFEGVGKVGMGPAYISSIEEDLGRTAQRALGVMHDQSYKHEVEITRNMLQEIRSKGIDNG